MSFAGPISDVLSGASLVMAVLAAVFAFWQPEINKALDAVVKPDKQNRAPERELVSQMKWGRVVPLLAITVAAAVLLAPRSVDVIIHTFMCWTGCAATSECKFDETGGLLLLTELLLVVLASAMGMQIKALNGKLAKLDK